MTGRTDAATGRQHAPATTIAEIGGALGCYTLIALLFAAPALLGRATLGPATFLDRDPLYRTGPLPAAPMVTDMTPAVVDLPRDLTIVRAAGSGAFPKWNPLSACGAPLWAEQAGPFFPLRLPLYLFPSPVAYEWFRVLRLLAAATGAYLLARYRGLRHWPGVAAGATFELSGSMVEMMPFGASSAIYVLPWALLGAAAIARRGDGRACCGAAIALGAAGLGGHPTLLVVVFAGFGAAVAGHLVTAWRRARPIAPIAAWSAAAAGLGLGLAAPSLLPLVELSTHAASYKFAPKGTSTWWAALVQSRASLGPAWLAPHALQALQAHWFVSHAQGAAVGVVTLVLAVAGLFQGGLDAALLAVALLGITLATAPPGLGLVYALPLTQVVLPYYTWALVALPLTQAAAAALDRCDTAAGRRRIALALALASAALVSLWAVPDVPLLPLSRLPRLAFQTPAGILRLLLPFATLGAALVTARAAGASGAWLRPLLGGLAIVELLLLWRPLWPQEPSQVPTAPPSPAVAFLQTHLADADGRFAAVPVHTGWSFKNVAAGLKMTPGWPFSSMLFGLADLRGASALPVARYQAYMSLIDLHASTFTLQQIETARHPLVDLAAVRYIVQPRPNDNPAPARLDDDPRLPLAYADEFVRIYENRAALPRVRIAHRTLPTPDQATARGYLHFASAGAAHADERKMGTGAVFVEPGARGEPPPELSGTGSADEYARIVDASHPDRLGIDVRLDSPGVVVVADTFYPGWRAWVDGVETPIYPADLLFRAVSVPAGTHVIEMRYEPASFRYGVAAGALAWLVLGALWLRRPGRSPGAEPIDSPAARPEHSAATDDKWTV